MRKRGQGLLQRFVKATRPLVSPGETVLVAVSGGADSLALLDLASQAAPSLEITPVVVHLDHGWRDESAEDAEFVITEASRRGLAVVVERAQLDADRSEAAARASRLGLFARSAARLNASGVLLGHTADDQSETVLLHLLRGSGAQGLGGMRTSNRIEVDSGSIKLLRPLLGIRRAELRAYCRAAGLVPREDATNEDARYARNRLRAELLPVAEAVAPGATLALARAAAILGDDADYLAQVAREHLSQMVLTAIDATRLELPRRELIALPVAVQRAALRAVATQLIGPVPEVSLERIEAARVVILRARGGAVLQWPGFVDVRVERGNVIFERRR